MAHVGTRIRKGDTVRVTLGKDAGKEGKVLKSIAPDNNPKKPRPSRLVIEGINIIIKHKRRQVQQNVTPSAQQQQSGRIELEAPVFASKVMLVCPQCGKPTRVGVKTNDSGVRYRACKQCGKQID